MTEISIVNFRTNGVRMGIVAGMDIRIGDMMTVQNWALIRPQEDPGYVHLTPPVSVRTGKGTVTVSPVLLTELNGRAAALYSAATGIKVRGASRLPSTMKTKIEKRNTTTDHAEDDDAGMRRVIGETLDRAGL